MSEHIFGQQPLSCSRTVLEGLFCVTLYHMSQCDGTPCLSSPSTLAGRTSLRARLAVKLSVQGGEAANTLAHYGEVRLLLFAVTFWLSERCTLLVFFFFFPLPLTACCRGNPFSPVLVSLNSRLWCFIIFYPYEQFFLFSSFFSSVFVSLSDILCCAL